MKSDAVSTERAQTFADRLQVRYAMARSSSDIERVFPSVERLPMTYLLDRSFRLVAMYSGELDMPALEQDIRKVLARSPGA